MIIEPRIRQSVGTAPTPPPISYYILLLFFFNQVSDSPNSKKTLGEVMVNIRDAHASILSIT
ncbi:unnamed protein product [Arabidopsis lyrata]|uniref:Predicted protein n=2 Tax=Arabidopsis TaxID=3701 RepID=D7MEW4_ARALL|nr:predicted protein [Arabidopsis lyrata subsp. lyrata]KAG7544392.1 hypothetical protein ISN44_As12g000050 [Arabidopsis suecica]CAH8273698.1 unnamed protein product [Arabidopsis lyrata]